MFQSRALSFCSGDQQDGGHRSGHSRTNGIYVATDVLYGIVNAVSRINGTARRCVEDFGVAIINDISARTLDDRMFETIARLQVPYIAMHMKGSPQTMMEDTDYANLMQEILLHFAGKVTQLHQMGVNDIWIDPGFGFSKTTAQNYRILDKLEEFHIFELPVLVGFSRKTMIRDVLATTPAESLNGTTALNMYALTKGAHILRVHDVKEAVQTVRLYNTINNTDV
ncbi:hypothetical protein AGMMS50239_41430 [Bacteroidia bacterium]|nr:hypothetical protein AGMMS50239_41430 [Bacteroidia bacterium]